MLVFKKSRFYAELSKRLGIRILFIVLACTCLIQAVANPWNYNDSAYQLHQQAKEAYANRRFLLADQKFQQAIALDSAHPQYRIDYAQMLFDRNLYIPAREQLEAVLRHHPNHLQTIRLLFADACRHRLYSGVMKYGTMLLNHAPDMEVTTQMAEAMYYSDDNMAAIGLLEQVVASKPTATAYVMLGRCYNDVNDHKRAINAYLKATELEPQKSRTWYELALLWVVNNDYPKAATCMEQAALRGEKQDAAFIENLANIYLQAGQLYKGIQIFTELLQKRQPDGHSMFMMAQALYKARKYEEAYQWWQKAYNLDNTNYRALYMMGKSLLMDGKQKKGEALCNEAIAKDPSLQHLRREVDPMTGMMY
ncbi:MAG TPA: tetratricopeptide repeat protein [Phnomibacter sp.]|nr:tetratricopeptide repeat protein [Phnomibacter sp.]